MTKKCEALIETMRASPKGVRFRDLKAVCDELFGEPRQTKGSHVVYQMPWPGDPRINIQDKNGEAKVYQVRQVLQAIDRLESQDA